MPKSQQTFNKKEKEKKRLKKREEKQRKKEERKSNSVGGELEDMIAYVDEFGNILDSPPEETKKKKDHDIQISTPKRPPEDTQKKGRLVHFNEEKGYGFIESLNGMEKVFVHQSEFTEDISIRNLVEYETEQDARGVRAVNVKKA